MLSAMPVESASVTSAYFAQDNYYTRDEGLEHSQWFGSGAGMLDLSGLVDEKAFLELLNGNVAGQQLGRIAFNDKGEKINEHRPGIDLTFSAPKSISIVAEVLGDSRVRGAHEAAVSTALNYVEKHLINARKSIQGKTFIEQTGNMVVAQFRHNTSRELDPQTHTHNVILNVTQRADGQWRSIANDELFRAQRMVGAIYTAELAAQVKALGYQIERSDDKGNFEIVGFTKEQLDHFSQRSAQIDAALHARGIDPTQATAEQREIAALSTRQAKKDVNHDQLLEEWQSRAEALGIDLDKLKEASRQYEAAALLPGGQRQKEMTGGEALGFAIAHLTEREAVVDRNLLLSTAIEHGAGNVSPGAILEAFERERTAGRLLETPDGQLTTAKMLASEEWLLSTIKEHQQKMPAIADREAVEVRLAGIEERGGRTMTAGQHDATVMALTSSDQFVAVQGYAGVGKTTMLTAVKDIAEAHGYKVRGMSISGSASNQLRQETGMESDTVKMFQIKEHRLRREQLQAQAEGQPHEPRGKELWVVDESSFLGQRETSRLIRLAKDAEAKIVFVGDTRQLSAIEAGKPFELSQAHGIATAHMTEIQRQKTSVLKEAVSEVIKHQNGRAFEILDKAGKVREIPRDKAEEAGDKAAGGINANLLDAVASDVLAKTKAERSETLVITAFNKDRQAINERVREGLKKTGEIQGSDSKHHILVNKSWTKAQIKSSQYYKAGDVVRFGRDYRQFDATKGMYATVVAVDQASRTVTLSKEDGTRLEWKPKQHNAVEVYQKEERNIAPGDSVRLTRGGEGLFNGDRGIVQSIQGDEAKIQFGNTEKTLNLKENPHWDHAYALTLHASQGLTAKEVLFVVRDTAQKGKEASEDGGGGAMDYKLAKIFGERSFLVGVTRASHNMTIYTDDKASAMRQIRQEQDKSSAIEAIKPDLVKTQQAQKPVELER